MKFEWRGAFRSLRRRVGWSTESKALAKSIARAAVREAGFCWLNPTATVVDRGSKAVVVEWRGLKPCWESLGVRVAVRCGSMSRSSTLEAGHRSDMGRYDFPRSGCLPALRRGTMVAFFQMSGISARLIDRLNMSVRYCVPEGPRCFRCSTVRPSGPVAVELLHCLIALVVYSEIKGEKK